MVNLFVKTLKLFDSPTFTDDITMAKRYDDNVLTVIRGILGIGVYRHHIQPSSFDTLRQIFGGYLPVLSEREGLERIDDQLKFYERIFDLGELTDEEKRTLLVNVYIPTLSSRNTVRCTCIPTDLVFRRMKHPPIRNWDFEAPVKEFFYGLCDMKAFLTADCTDDYTNQFPVGYDGNGGFLYLD